MCDDEQNKGGCIVHLTSVHSRYDTRIFLKECCSLAKAGFNVSLVVADGKGNEEKEGIAIFDVGKSSGRLNRILSTTRQVFREAKRLNALIYHIHDPELIPTGLKLKKLGKVVIFDAHEDVPKQMLGKPYLSPIMRKLLSKVFSIYEKWICKDFDIIITATPAILEKFLKINPKSININNFPILGELSENKCNWHKKSNQVCYIGGISSIRAIKEMVRAMEYVQHNTHLVLGGNFSEVELETEVKTYEGWQQINQLGFVGRDDVRHILSDSIAGLVVFLPLPNHVDAQPNKMFEYMSAGIPVIASNFPLWQEIIEGNHCGLCVNPLNPVEIAEAIDFLTQNQDVAKQMGENGQKTVFQYYNWTIEETKLLNLYQQFIER